MPKLIDIKDLDEIVDETVSDAEHAALIKKWLHEDEAAKDSATSPQPVDQAEDGEADEDDLWDNLPV